MDCHFLSYFKGSSKVTLLRVGDFSRGAMLSRPYSLLRRRCSLGHLIPSFSCETNSLPHWHSFLIYCLQMTSYYLHMRSEDLLCVFMAILKHYQATLGQLVNEAKCIILLPNNVHCSCVQMVAATTNFDGGSFPFTCLSVLVVPRKRSARHFWHIVNRIVERYQGWQAKLLSEARRLVLIKHLVNFIPIHLLTVTLLLVVVVKKVEWIQANFFWVDQIMVSIDIGRGGHFFVCRWQKRGLGLQNFRHISWMVKNRHWM